MVLSVVILVVSKLLDEIFGTSERHRDVNNIIEGKQLMFKGKELLFGIIHLVQFKIQCQMVIRIINIKKKTLAAILKHLQSKIFDHLC